MPPTILSSELHECLAGSERTVTSNRCWDATTPTASIAERAGRSAFTRHPDHVQISVVVLMCHLLFATRQYTVLDGDDVHAQTGRRVVSGLHQHIRGVDHAVDWQVRSKMVGQVGWPATERAQHADKMPIRMAIPLETNEVEGDTNF